MTTQQRSSPSGPSGGRKFTSEITYAGFAADGDVQTVNITLPGAKVTDVIRSIAIPAQPAIPILNAIITAPDTVQCFLHNLVGSGIVGATTPVVGELGTYTS